jgi:hypothetical protein
LSTRYAEPWSLPDRSLGEYKALHYTVAQRVGGIGAMARTKDKGRGQFGPGVQVAGLLGGLLTALALVLVGIAQTETQPGKSAWSNGLTWWALGFVALAFVVVGWGARGAFRSSREDATASAPSARIKAKDSPGWEFEDTSYEGSNPLAEVENSPGWKWRKTRIGYRAEEQEPEPPQSNRPTPQRP